MPNYQRAMTKGGTYFFTVVTFQRQKILCELDIRTALRDGIRATQKIHPFCIDAWVLLPDHLHCIWTLPLDDANFSVRWAMIKRYVSKECGSKFQHPHGNSASKIKRNESTIWQRRFWEHQIRDEHDYEKHMDYLHFNPVKHGYVSRAADWPYSTLLRLIQEGVYDKNWGWDNSVDMDDTFGE